MEPVNTNSNNAVPMADQGETAFYSIDQLIESLKIIASDASVIHDLPESNRVELMKLCGIISRPDRNQIRLRNKKIRKFKKKQITDHDKLLRANSQIRQARQASVFSAPQKLLAPPVNTTERVAISERNCYVCKALFRKIHFFYDSMCPDCADFNYQKRYQSAPLDTRVALITGSRLKIGYQASLQLLRAGASLIATTRFPIDSATRFSQEKDFKDWQDRLHIYGLDLRHTPSVEIFARHISKTFDRLDILINNAAQTVRRPPGFYAHLMEAESLAYESLSQSKQRLLASFQNCLAEIDAEQNQSKAIDNQLPVAWNGRVSGMGLKSSASLSQIPYTHDQLHSVDEIFPKGKLDSDLQQVDLRATNSWRLKLGDIQTAEMIEVQLVNAIAPFVLCNQLIPLMKKDFTGQKHIVNVSAMEGKFHRFKKADRHPHTNMAKAALNMLTHTSAGDLQKYGIHCNAVDTGWVTDEDPALLARLKTQKHDFEPPLDIVDGAARILDPVFDGIRSGRHWNGKFLKDYKPIDW